MSYLTAHNLSIGYRHKNGATTVLKDLNLSLERGSLVALLGANGAGKSTLLRTITAVQPAISGTVELCGCDINNLSQRERSRIIGIVTTDRIMAGGLTVFELVSLGRQPHTGFLGRLSKTDKECVAKALSDAGIAHKAQCYVSQLSDGERQKAMIAKSLAQNTPIIILDEPTAFLDVANRFETMRLLHDLAHKHNKAVLLSSHDISQSLLLADKVWLIKSNHEVIAGNTEDLVLNGSLDNLFDSKSLQFNKSTSDFEAVLPHTMCVTLSCADNALSRCITNALMRNGVAVAQSAQIHITAHDPSNITIDDCTAKSIAEMILKIKSLQQTDQSNETK